MLFLQVRLEARIVGGPLRVDYLCAPSGARCDFHICRLFEFSRLSQQESAISQPHKVVRDRTQVRFRMNDHIRSEGHDQNQHRKFVNVFYSVANHYTYNGRRTRYVLIQFHPDGHPSLDEPRSHFHIRPAWIEDGQFRYNDTATPELDNFTPSEHYFYDEDDMENYWFDEAFSGCREEEDHHDDEDRDRDAGGTGSTDERGRQRNRRGSRDRSRSRSRDGSGSGTGDRSGSGNGGGYQSGSETGDGDSHILDKCNCKWISAAGAATKYVVKRQGIKTTGKALANYAVKRAGVKAGGKIIAKHALKKGGVKAGGKVIAKKIPFLGLAAGVGFGLVRCCQGDFSGAVAEVASGAVSCIPVVGTAASVAIDGCLLVRDMSNAGPDVCSSCGKMK